ncbi:hypoxanthine phosphoribosyltransferase [Mycoplasmopsis ciconiae]|uniref:Hypoxanthine phosphoribosyltransferase n=1 Tax=Mycoplasmopsis ciconiae TaxID=561067 RepID=A0ABU7MM63_9BACT|nr:hypoxanthine phosphoribosyltransferase [Mycoplasmopsis ciconiae]
MQKHPKIKEILYDFEYIKKHTIKCADYINNEFKNSKDLIIVALLKGSVPFLAELIKHVSVDHKIDFMIASSYSGSHASSGNVKIIMDLAFEIENKDVVIVEDIIDSGITLDKIKKILLSRNPKKLKIVTLMDKPHNRKADIKADCYGFEVADEFLVGFGLDYKEELRNLPYIGIFDEKYL